MANTAALVQQLIPLLAATLSADSNARKTATSTLMASDRTPGLGVALLTLVTLPEVPEHVRTAGALYFKNFVKRLWEEEDAIVEADRTQIRTHLVNVLASVPELIRRQLSEALKLISRFDFPHRWPTLLPELVAKLGTEDMTVVNGVLDTAASIFEPFRSMPDTDDLRIAIVVASTQFGPPLTNVVQAAQSKVAAFVAAGASKADLSPYLRSLTLATNIVNSLTLIDLPQHFADNLRIWIDMFHTFLSLTAPTILAPEGEAGPLEDLQATILDVVALFADKYDEEIEEFFPLFVDDVWKLLTNYSLTRISAPALDPLVTQACKFLAASVARGMNSRLFEKPEFLRSMVERIVVPNMLLRDTDEELFEDNPVDFIRKDIEGSDADTRRRVATDLVRAMVRNFEAQATALCLEFATALLTEYNANRAANYAKKDAAIALLIAVAVKAQTAAQGVTATNEGVNLGVILLEHVYPELNTQNVDEMPIVKAACIKFFATFRNQFSKENLLALLDVVARYTRAKSFVVHTYAASAVERVLLLKDRVPNPEGPPGRMMLAPRLPLDSVAPLIGPLLGALFELMNRKDYPENEYLMKCAMRLVSFAKDRIAPLAAEIITALTGILTRVCANPTNPMYNHYLFEIIAVAMRNVCTARPETVNDFEALLFPPFQHVLTNEVAEFTPYVFQLLAELLELRPAPAPDGHSLTAGFQSLGPLILHEALWAKKGNVPALAQLLEAYCRRGMNFFAANDLVPRVLKIFEDLLKKKGQDELAFDVVNAFFEGVPLQVLGPVSTHVFRLLLEKLQTSKSAKIAQRVAHSFALFAGVHGAVNLEAILNAFGPATFQSTLTHVMCAQAPKITDAARRKEIAIGCTRILTEVASLLADPSLSAWLKLVETIVMVLEGPRIGDVASEEALLDYEAEADNAVEDAVSNEYSAAFAKLAFGTDKSRTAFPTIPDAKRFFVESLVRLAQTQPGRLSAAIGTLSVAPNVVKYASDIGVAIP